MFKIFYFFLVCCIPTNILSVPITVDSTNNFQKLTFHIRGELNWVPDINGELQSLTESEIEEDIFYEYKSDSNFYARSEPEIVRRKQFDFNVKFYLFTRLNPSDGYILEVNNLESINQSNFNAKNPTRIIIHGWQNHKSSPVNVLIRDAYLLKDNFNIIVVDWSEGASNLKYSQSRNSVNYVGSKVADMIWFLKENAQLNLDTLHLVGHSLGAHICGLTGKLVKDHNLNTIIGLDPAGPLFYEEYPDERLSVDDAEYVEVIHTNAGFYGIQTPIGDADYYINGGEKQPGCGFDILRICSHSRAFELFAESINSPDGFWSMPCNLEELNNKNCSRPGVTGMMGDIDMDKKYQIIGTYKLLTRSNPPFAMGKSVLV